VSTSGRVRDGVVIKLRREVHTSLTRIVGEYLSRHGERVTYSDVIMALLEKSTDPIKAVEEYLRRRGGRR